VLDTYTSDSNNIRDGSNHEHQTRTNGEAPVDVLFFLVTLRLLLRLLLCLLLGLYELRNGVTAHGVGLLGLFAFGAGVLERSQKLRELFLLWGGLVRSLGDGGDVSLLVCALFLALLQNFWQAETDRHGDVHILDVFYMDYV